MMESSKKEWQKTKDTLISQLFDKERILSPVCEETESEDASLSPLSSFLDDDPDRQNCDNVAADIDETSSESSVSTYPELIIEREKNRHDHPKEFYQELWVRMRKFYRKIWFGICDEPSSTGDNPDKEIANKTADEDKTERLCSYEPKSNEQIQDKPNDNLTSSSSIPRDDSSANSRPSLSKRRRPVISISPDTRESEERLETDGDRPSLENRTETKLVHHTDEAGIDSSVQSSESSSTRRGQSHVAHLEDNSPKKDKNQDNTEKCLEDISVAAESDKSNSNMSIEQMRNVYVDSIHSKGDSMHGINLSHDKSADIASLEHERELISFNAELSNDLPSLNIITSTPTHFDIEVDQNLDLNDNNNSEKSKKRKMTDTRAVKRKCYADFTTQTSFEELQEDEVSWYDLKHNLFVGEPTVINIVRRQ